MQENVCCFIGHRDAQDTTQLRRQLYDLAEDLIVNHHVDTFLFGSKSRFNTVCYEQTTKLKTMYPHIKRVYVRAEFPQICDDYKAYLLERYEDTYYPEQAVKAGKAVYIKRNQAMIRASRFCVFYFQKDHDGGGTQAALDYARKQNTTVFLLPK